MICGDIDLSGEDVVAYLFDDLDVVDEAGDNENPSDEQEATLLPMTNSGTPPTEIVMKDESFMPMYALLNTCGSLLTQTNGKLTGS